VFKVNESATGSSIVKFADLKDDVAGLQTMDGSISIRTGIVDWMLN
jgi:hypothetical protein